MSRRRSATWQESFTLRPRRVGGVEWQRPGARSRAQTNPGALQPSICRLLDSQGRPMSFFVIMSSGLFGRFASS